MELTKSCVGNRQSHAGNVYFLKGVAPDQIRGYVSGNGHQRNGIQIGCRDSGHQLVAPGPDVAMTVPTFPVARK